MQENLINYIKDQENPNLNFILAKDYDKLGQYAAAISFYIRTAERSDDPELRSEALFLAGMCFYNQNRRNYTAEGLLQYAIQENTGNIDAYIELSKLYANQQKWRESSLYATLCPDKNNPHILYQKYLALWHIGLCEDASMGMIKLKKENEIFDKILLDKIDSFIETKIDKKMLMNQFDFINVEYENAKNTKSDINEHLEVLYALGSECDSITEVGVRTGNSTRAFLKTRKKLTCYDIASNEEIFSLIEKAKSIGIDVNFIEANILSVDIKETDLLFIDSLHTYKQLKQELKLHGNKAKKYIVFHDTITYGLKNEINDGSEKNGLIPALMEFLSENQYWRIKNFYANNNGLTVIERVRDDN